MECRRSPRARSGAAVTRARPCSPILSPTGSSDFPPVPCSASISDGAHWESGLDSAQVSLSSATRCSGHGTSACAPPISLEWSRAPNDLTDYRSDHRELHMQALNTRLICFLTRRHSRPIVIGPAEMPGHAVFHAEWLRVTGPKMPRQPDQETA